MHSTNVPHRRRLNRDTIDMTSMVDVTFLLLIFFMVTASFHLQKSISIPSQPSQAGVFTEENPPADVRVQVDARGSFFVMTPTMEFETPAKQQLIEVLNQAINESDATRMSVEVHEMAKLQSLVHVLDAGATVGMTDIRVAEFKSFDSNDVH
ncbi:MAG: ExbD/TolR family protein [Rubripirellula sp.]